jgi:two-component system, LytTR family, response regulator
VKSLSYILADDDVVIRELVSQYLQLIPNITCLAICEDAFKAKEAMQIAIPDFLILDVEMPHLSGLQFVKSLTTAPYIIFISSHLHYAAEAFEVDAVDYLVKPIHVERLIRSIDKVRELIDFKTNYKAEEVAQLPDSEGFFIRENSSYVRVLYQDVLYIESMADFVNIYLNNGSKKLALVNLKNIELQLPTTTFVRISRTHIVNKQRVEAIDNNSITLSKLRLPIGKTFSEEVVKSIIGNSAIKRHT